MQKFQKVIALCAILVTISLGANAMHDNNGKKIKKNKNKGKSTYVVQRRGYATSECRTRMDNVQRHIRRIVQAEARASNMSGPVSVASVTTSCGPGESVTISARTLVGLQWYQFRCELLPTDKNPNSPVGWIGKNHVWDRIGPVVVIQPAPTPTPIPTPAPRRPSR